MFGDFLHPTMFGDFLHPDKHRALTGDALSCLEDGTPVVARYNARHFQFGIYGNGYVIYQDCQPLTNQVLVFSIKKIPAKEFFRQATAYEYTPDFEYDKRLAFHNAQYNLLLYTTKVILAEEQLFSVFGDDFTLFCMLGDYERFYNAFLSSRVGKRQLQQLPPVCQ